MAEWGMSRRGAVGHLLGEPAKGPLFRSRCQPNVVLKPVAGEPASKCHRCAAMERSQSPLQTPRDVLVALLAFVDSFCREHGFGPTARELCLGLGVSSTSVAWWRARAVARLGWLDWEPGKARTLRLTEAGSAVLRGSGNGPDLASWLLRLDLVVAEMDGHKPEIEILVMVAGLPAPVAHYWTKGDSLGEEQG